MGSIRVSATAIPAQRGQRGEEVSPPAAAPAVEVGGGRGRKRAGSAALRLAEVGEAAGPGGREAPVPVGGGQRGNRHKGRGPRGQLALHGGRGSLTAPREGDTRWLSQGLAPPARGWEEPAPLASVRHLRSLFCPFNSPGAPALLPLPVYRLSRR